MREGRPVNDKRYETNAELQLRLNLETEVRKMADKIADFGERGACAYVSNGEREDVLRLMKEWINRQEGK